LDGLATPGVDEQEGNPVSWDKTCDGEDEVSDTNVLEVLINVTRRRLGSSGVTKVDGGQNNGAVIESDLRWISDKKSGEYGMNIRRE